MTVIESKINTRSEEYADNRAFMQTLVDELNQHLEKAREKLKSLPYL